MALKPATDFSADTDYNYQAIQVEARTDFNTGELKKDKDGQYLWNIDCLRTAPNEPATTVSVTVASPTNPEVSGMIHFEGLRMSYWSNSSNSGVSWRAISVENA